jgi:hypothetical protein
MTYFVGRSHFPAYAAIQIIISFYKSDPMKKLIPWSIFRFKVVNQRFRFRNRLQTPGSVAGDYARSKYWAKQRRGKHARRDLSDTNATCFNIGFSVLARKTISALQ